MSTEPIRVVWVDRATAGLPPAPRAQMTRRPVQLLGTTVHYTDTPDGDDPKVRWHEIWREATQGGLADRYVDTPYNAGVCKLAPGVGAVLAGRPNDVIGAHTRPIANHPTPPTWPDVANLYTLGVALVGTHPTPEALAALRAYLFVANAGEHAPLIFPHSFWDPTACPGDELRGFLFKLGNPNVHLTDK